MAEIILFPTTKGYCEECIYHDPQFVSCQSKDYQKNSYKVNCVWGYCKYKKKRKEVKQE